MSYSSEPTQAFSDILSEASVAPIATHGVRVSAEVVIYFALLIFVSLSYLLRLGDVPLSTAEVPRALAAWGAIEPTFPTTAVADSALLQFAHMLTLTIFGSSEAAIRLPTALVSILLVFSPLLFRDLLGRGRTFVMVVLLICSPIMLASARLDNGVVWEVGPTILGLWAVWRYLQSQAVAYALAATVLFGVTVFLAGPTGYLLTGMVVGAFFLAERFQAPTELDLFPTVAARIRGWAWLPALGLTAIVVLAVSTVFMVYPAGFNAVSAALGTGLYGWFRPQPDAPALFPLFVSLLYEPILWVFGIIGVVQILNRDTPSAADLYLVALLVITGIASVLYRGAGAGHALWLTFPLITLTAGAVITLLRNADGVLWSDNNNDYDIMGFVVPAWGRLLVTIAVVGLGALMLMQLGAFFRALQTVVFNNPSGGGLFSPAYSNLTISALLVLVLLLLVVFLAFTAASVWGGRTILRSGTLGLLLLGVGAMFGSGWQIAYSRADSPVEVWHAEASGQDVFVLHETLLTLADRESGGFTELPVTVVTDENAGVTANSIIAWTLRDFPNATYVRQVADAAGQPVVIMAPTLETPTLGGNYLGQTFTLVRDWDISSLTLQEAPRWWYQRVARVPAEPSLRVVLWLREDVYAGVDIDGLP